MKALIPLILSLCVLLCACSPSTYPDSTEPSSRETDSSVQFSKRDQNTDPNDAVEVLLEGSTASCESKGISVTESTVNILAPGSYRLKGNLTGSVIVDVAKTDHVHLILDHAHIRGTETAALFVKQGEKVVVTLEGENSLITEGSFREDGSKIDAPIFAKDDLTFNGTGSLTVKSPSHGIVCKDDLVFYGGSYTVEASRHCFSTENSIRIADGSFTLQSGKDCLNTDNSENPDSAYIYIEDGLFRLTAAGDGISSDSFVEIKNGDFQITAGGGSSYGPSHREGARGFSEHQDSTTTNEDTTSTKGIKAAGEILLKGGSLWIDAADDGIHSNRHIEIYDGTYVLQSGDDGIHGEERLLVQGGDIQVSKSYEGLEAHCIDINGGKIDIVATDDGLNAAGGVDGSGNGWNDMFANDENAYISIAAGQMVIDAQGDGIDSNGALSVSGGQTFVSGPTNGGNGTLDYNGEGTITGGTFIAAGTTGMAMGFNTAENQGVIFVSYNSQPAESMVSLTNAAGEKILRWKTTKASSSIVLSCPDIQQGETYHLTVGSIQGDITMTELIYGKTAGGPAGNPGGRPGR